MTAHNLQVDPHDPHCRYPKCECPPSHCQRLDAPFRIDTDSDFTIDIGRDKAALAELGRRHPAAADDVDAILAMPRSDSVNEGLIQRHASAYVARGAAISDSIIAECKASREALLAALRAVPSPDTVGVLELPAWEDARVQTVYKLLCDDKLDEPPNPEEHWEGWISRNIVAALSPSHCTVGRRELDIQISVLKELFPTTQADANFLLSMMAFKTDSEKIDAIVSFRSQLIAAAVGETLRALTSEQSGPTAGSGHGK